MTFQAFARFVTIIQKCLSNLSLLLAGPHGQNICFALSGLVTSGCTYDMFKSDEAFKESVGHDVKPLDVLAVSIVPDPADQEARTGAC